MDSPNIFTNGRQLRKLLTGLPAAGFEGSVKLSRQSILDNRFLLGIQKTDLPLEHLIDICGGLQFPGSFLETLNDYYPEASQLLFGYEESTNGDTYKVYLEYWEKIRHDLKTKLDKEAPVLLHLGFKWNPLNPEQKALTRYTCYPLLSVAGIYNKLTGIYEKYND